MAREHHKPAPMSARFFESVEGGSDPALVAEAGERAAEILVRGPRSESDGAVADRLVHLADTEGMEAIAEVWAGAPADSLAGCLWRLYVLRSWVYADPAGVASAFDRGRASDRFAEVVAGVADPPGPDELRAMIDDVLRGIVTRDFADVLLRASAFARIMAAGQAGDPAVDVRRLLGLAEQLEAAGHAELAGPSPGTP
ncbi:hypothetical protein [Nocardioides montaniterrae]